MKRFFEFILEAAKMFIIALVIILPIRYFLVQPFYVKGASMEPNFHERDYLLVDEITYRFHEAKRGDIVVFKYPEDPQEYFIKRVIALPGETVTIKDGDVIITDAKGETIKLSESYLPDYTTTTALTDQSVTLKPNEYFFLGDNRNASKDSRSFGPVNKSFIIGRVFFRGWPIDRAGVITNPGYSAAN